MQLQTPLLAAAAFVVVTVAALATGSDVPTRDDTLTWTDIAQAEEDEKLGKVLRKRKAHTVQKDDDDDDDDVEDDGRRHRRVCPAGQRPTPHRGRGGDQGGCI